MDILVLEYLIPIFIGALASFIVWYIPAERFIPTNSVISYNQHKEDECTINPKGEITVNKILKRNIHLINSSRIYAAYNITCFFEYIDDECNIVYHEEKQQAYMAANTKRNHPLVIPFKVLYVSEIEKLKPINIRLFLVYENRYGTKKISGPWLIKGYNLDKNSFEPKLENI